MNFKIDINSDEIVSFANKLEKLPRSAFPNVVRGTLNSLAFDVKKNTMPKSAKRFINRDKNFFKANSRVQTARGMNVSQMGALVGFVANNKTKSNQAVEDLEDQEIGGNIKGRSFIPLKSARTSKSNRRMVAKRNRLKNIRNVVVTNETHGKTKQAKFVNSVLKAGVGGFVLGSSKKGENILWRVDGMSTNIKTRRFKPKLTALYSYSANRTVSVKGTRFMQKAVRKTNTKQGVIFEKEAHREFKKHLSWVGLKGLKVVL